MARPSKCAMGFGIGFVFCYLVLLLMAVFIGDHSTQSIVSLVSFPTSSIVMHAASPMVAYLSLKDYSLRIIGEWMFLGIAGLIQYLSVGLMVGFLLGPEKEPRDRRKRL